MYNNSYVYYYIRDIVLLQISFLRNRHMQRNYVSKVEDSNNILTILLHEHCLL